METGRARRKGTFTMPADVPDAKVMELAPRYIEPWVKNLEEEGWRLVSRVRLQRQKELEIGDEFKGITDTLRKRYFMVADFAAPVLTHRVEADDATIELLARKFPQKVKKIE